MGCLSDITCGSRVIIGIRDFDACARPESDLFINDLPGISLKAAAKITSEEHHTGAEIMKACINIATKKVFKEFSEAISPEFDFNTVIQTRQIDIFNDAIVPAANIERGLIYKRWRSELSKIYIEEVYLKATSSGVANLKIYDGTTLVKTIPVDLLANTIVTVPIRLSFDQEQVKVLSNNTNFDFYSGSINNFLVNGRPESCYACGSKGSSNFVINGWDGTKEVSQLFGIGTKASVRCYEENIICSVLPKMYFLIWYASGVQFLKERAFSDRLNNITLFTKDKAKELLEEYEAEYASTYKAFSKSIFKYLKSTKGECLTCKPTIYAQYTP